MTKEPLLTDWYAMALACHQSGDLMRAESLYLQILDLNPQHAEAIHGLGVIAYQRGTPEIGIEKFRKALELKPGYLEARCNLGALLISQNRHLEALDCYDPTTLTLAPSLETHRAHVLAALGRWEEAVQGYRRGLAHDPSSFAAWSGLGKALSHLGRGSEAVAAFQEALRIAPDSAEAHFNLATGLKRAGHLIEALNHYDDSIDRDPENPLTRVNRSTTLLLAGEYGRGWREYEWRWKLPGNTQPSLPGTAWDGQPQPGGTILLQTEQGLGDTLQFVRYASLVRQRVSRVILRAPARLIPLLSSCPGIDAFADDQQPPPDCDVHAHLMSLPLMLGMTSGTVPADVPYLSANMSLVQSWKERLAKVGGKRIGVCWQGNPLHPEDSFRSFKLKHLELLSKVPGVRLVSLQSGYGAEQLEHATFPIEDFGPDLDQSSGTFMDTAAIMKNLDLVVTADTSIAHLAGSLGVPVWIALAHVPDWRWLMSRADTAWYPTARLFRQPATGDWNSVFTEMALSLSPIETKCQSVSIEIAPGELFDRISILQIKAEKMTNPSQLSHVRAELSSLEALRDRQLPEWRCEQTRVASLRSVNATLWDVENALRACERDGDFGKRFIELARSVYRHNDARATLKRELSERFGATVLEQKSYH